MRKAKAIRIAGFIGALCASAALIGTAVQGTGAYFSDSHDGNLKGTAGHVTVNVDGQFVDFTGLMPGVDQSKTITFTPTGSANEDIWMVFNTTNSVAGEPYGHFSGAAGAPGYNGYTGGGLGGYGHFKVRGSQGFSFESYNLQVATGTEIPCPIDVNGDGGSADQATGPDNGSQAAHECGVPGAILLASDLGNGAPGSAVVTFGLTGKAKGTGGGVWANVPFKIVATQHGIRPDAPNF